MRSARNWRPSKRSSTSRALATDDPDFFTDLIEGESNLLEIIAALDASILDNETLVDGVKAALDTLQARKHAAENRIELKRRLPALAARLACTASNKSRARIGSCSPQCTSPR